MNTRKRGFRIGIPSFMRICAMQPETRALDHGNMCCLRAAFALDDFEFDHLILVERLVAFALDARVVNEHVAAAVRSLDETVALRCIEPFDLALHFRLLRFCH